MKSSKSAMGKLWALSYDLSRADAKEINIENGLSSLRERILCAATSPPFIGRNLPNLREKAARDVVAFFCSYEAHPALLRDTPGSDVSHSFGRPQDWKLERLKPEIGDNFTSFAHQPLPLPGQAEPETAVVFLTSH